MVVYRRAIVTVRKNNLWHWREECQSYPSRDFASSNDKPADDELCRPALRLAKRSLLIPMAAAAFDDLDAGFRLGRSPAHPSSAAVSFSAAHVP